MARHLVQPPVFGTDRFASQGPQRPCQRIWQGFGVASGMLRKPVQSPAGDVWRRSEGLAQRLWQCPNELSGEFRAEAWHLPAERRRRNLIERANWNGDADPVPLVAWLEEVADQK